MTTIKKGTKLYDGILYDYNNKNLGTIFDAYKKPCTNNIRAFLKIENRAKNTLGYNNDIKVVCASCHVFCTIYSYIQDGIMYIVKDTPKNTYLIQV